MTTAQSTSSNRNTISICGALVHLQAHQQEQIKQKMLEIDGLEIHGNTDDDKYIVTLESSSYHQTGDAAMLLQGIKGVLSLSIIYQHTEDIAT